jgi:dTDP-4-dehydrorhamnose 3,5-epimerase-like enzyme
VRITNLALSGVRLVQLTVHGDSRGFFMESYRDEDWRPILGERRFIQDNQSLSSLTGTEGFAHGFITLEPDSMIAYKVTSRYEPKSERGLAWDDPDLEIAWPVPASGALELSPRDRQWPRLRDLTDLF